MNSRLTLLLSPQPRQQAKDLCLHRHVQRRGRLIEDQQRRLARQCRGDQRTLLHAAAKLMGKARSHVLGSMDAHLVQQRYRPPRRLGGLIPRWLHDRLGDLPPDTHRRDSER